MSKGKDYWFKRRRFGWGWFPVTWQGWAVVLGYVALVIGVSSVLAGSAEARGEFPAESWFFLLFLVVASIILIRIGYLKGPKPKWRWGSRPGDSPDEDW